MSMTSHLRQTRRPRAMVFDLDMAESALPLLARIVAEIVTLQSRAADYDRAANVLRRQRDARRFQTEDRLRETRDQLRLAMDELHQLGGVLLDGCSDRVGLRTIINGKPAYFIYRSGDTRLDFWRYEDAGKSIARSIPGHWRAAAATRLPRRQESLAGV